MRPRLRIRPAVLLLLALGVTASACGASEGAGATGTPALHQPAPAGATSGRVSSGAASAGAESAGGAVPPSAGASGAGAPQLGAAVHPLAPDVIETATIHLRPGSPARLRDAVTEMTALAGEDGGYVQTSSVAARSATLTLRIPDPTLPAALAVASRLGTVTARQAHGQDVTGQVVDLAAEEANLQAEERAVRTILARATKVSDILTIQQQLFTLQGEIRQLQAQRDSLANQVQFATLTASFSLAAAPQPRPRRTGTLARTWQLASSHTLDAIRGVVLAVGWAAPGLALVVLGGAAGLLARRRRVARPGVGDPPTPAAGP